ncbi:helix-turn-helix transcriptional regulator [Piscirickettsia salmonis]|uniref:helix-turn-helix transcriptional regulator n=1 Tax=Piscirickettsia salmonis TaxID=1238 RepID=UPI003EBF553C
MDTQISFKSLKEYSKSELRKYEHIYSIRHYEHIKDITSDIHTNCGVDYICVGLFPALGAPYFISNMSRWSIPYYENNLFNFDSLTSPRTNLILGKDVYFQGLLQLTPEQQYIYNICSKFGIHESYAIFRASIEVEIMVLAHTAIAPTDPKTHYNETKEDFLTFASTFIYNLKDKIANEHAYLRQTKFIQDYSYMKEILKKEAYSYSLAPREKEVLYWAANGLNAKDTSKAIGVTPRVVEKYLASAQKRLLCKNKLHTVMKAKSLGLLDSF